MFCKPRLKLVLKCISTINIPGMGTRRLTASWTVSYVHLHPSNISYCSKFRYIRFRAFTVDPWANYSHNHLLVLVAVTSF